MTILLYANVRFIYFRIINKLKIVSSLFRTAILQPKVQFRNSILPNYLSSEGNIQLTESKYNTDDANAFKTF